MSCWLCDSFDEPMVSNKSPIRDMVGALYPKMLPNIPKVLDLCNGCFMELSTYYNFKLSYRMELKTESSEDENDFVDLTDDSDNEQICCVCSKKALQNHMCLVKERMHDDKDISFLSADLIRSYFPQIKLYISENPVTCLRCSDLLKGMHDYQQKVSVKLLVSSLKAENDAVDDVDHDYSISIERNFATLSGGAEIYKTNVIPVSVAKKKASDSNLQLEDDEDSMGNHSMFLHQLPTKNDANNPPSKLSQQIEQAQDSCDMFLTKKTSKGIMYQCERCPYASNRKDNTRRHIFIRHIKRNMMQKCPHCPLQTVSADILANHIEQKHKNLANVKNYPCSSCDFKAATFNQLRYHSQTKHMDDKSLSTAYACKMCHFVTSRLKYLQKHIRYKHTDSVAYSNCEFCNYHTRRKDNLRQHVEHMHRDQHVTAQWPGFYTCYICGFKCTRKDKLRRHMDCIHADEDKKLRFKCGACEYICTGKGMLKRHVEHQHSKKAVVFKCNRCSYSSDVIDYFQEHVKYAHTQPEKVYQCHLCSYSTSKKILFEQHYRRRHGSVPPLQMEDGCECYFKAGGYKIICVKCRSIAEETEVICLDDDSEKSEENAVKD